jgi:hypothetical protein
VHVAVATVGWEPRYAVIGLDLKVVTYAGLGAAQVTDLDDRAVADGSQRLARHAGQILRALRGETAMPFVPGPAEGGGTARPGR